MTYVELTSSVLVKTQEFEVRYLQPYLNKQERLLQGSEKDDKVDAHVAFLSEYVRAIRAHVEAQTLFMQDIQELKQKLIDTGIDKEGELKISMKAQGEALLPVLKKLIDTEI